MLTEHKFDKAADYCMRRDWRARREQILAIINGLMESGTGWQYTHRTRITNLVARGVEVNVLDSRRDAGLYDDLKNAQIPCPGLAAAAA